MAQHNYFGFTAPVTQYAPQPTAYAQPQAAYVPAGQAYAQPAARPAAQYQAYDTGHGTAYAYTPAPPAPAARPAVVTVAVTPQYQAVQVKPSYTSAYSTPARSVTNVPTNPLAAKPGGGQVSNYSYVANAAYSTPAPQPAAHAAATPISNQNAAASGSSYDAALYSAATNYYQQKQQTANQSSNNWQKKEQSTFGSFGQKKQGMGGGGMGRGGFGSYGMNRKKPGLGTQQTHYCEVCKISCAGPQTYKEHLEGQKHKKKEAQMKAGNQAANMRVGQSQLKCDLCDITCTGTDAYTAHIRGAKHQKTLNLHQRLGKPIPSSEPTIVTAGDGNTTTEVKSSKGVPANKVVATPAIKFVGGSTLHSLGGETKEVPKATAATGSSAVSSAADEEQDDLLLPGEKVIQPVGHEYIEETFDSAGKLLTFFCKLCDCKFNDPNAKSMHMKGRRHRTNYKKKVDPDLIVEVKQNSKVKRLQADRERAKNIRETLKKQRNEELAAVSEIRMLESDRFFPEIRGYNENFSDRVETYNDRHIMAKHASIYPTEDELQAIQVIVTACEKALKLVSDSLHEEEKEPRKDVEGKEIRAMKGVMRVGDLAKGLLLSKKLNIELIVLCSDKPTKTLLNKVYSLLPDKLKEISEEEFKVTVSVPDGAVIVNNTSTPSAKCSLILTSPLMREDMQPAEAEQPKTNPPTDILDKQKCIEALAALRHAKWFQARASTIPSCVPLLRVFKDLQAREEKFRSISLWATELLLERCMSTAVSPMGPGDAMRRFFEALSSGICLPGGPGLSDPCEKDPVDAFANLNPQTREILTSYSQTCLRKIAFKQITKILDMEPLPAGERLAGARKRPLSSNNDDEAAGEKKEKQETTQ